MAIEEIFNPFLTQHLATRCMLYTIQYMCISSLQLYVHTSYM